MYFIYKLTNKLNNKIYIGKTKNPTRRQVEHLSKSKVKTSYLYNSINKYGFENFDFEIIYENEDENKTYEMETFFIKQYNSNNKEIGYNSTSGGEGLKDISEDTRKKMSENAKLRVGDKNPFYGKLHTYETKLKIALSKSKITMDQVREIRNKFINGYSRIKLREEYKLSTAALNRILANKSYKEQ